MNPIPLSAPDGRVYAYACGVCHNVHSDGFYMGPWPADGPHAIEIGLRVAEKCCTCSGCGVGHEAKPVDPEAVRAWFEATPWVASPGPFHEGADMISVLRERMNLPPAPEPSEVIPTVRAPTPEQIAAWLEKHVEARDLYHGGKRYACKQCERRLVVTEAGRPATDPEIFKIALNHHRDCHAMTKTTQAPICCSQPMYACSIGSPHGWLCRKCERYERDGRRTPGPWWGDLDWQEGASPRGGTAEWAEQAKRPHAFQRGPADAVNRLGPPDETCRICARDPRNDIHQARGEAKRPLQVGDYVRWTLLKSGCWTEGVIKRCDGPLYDIAVERTHNWPAAEHLRAAGRTVCASNTERVSKVERVPRPAEATACMYCGGEHSSQGCPGREPAPAPVLVDSLDVEYDGVRLRTLLEGDEFNRRETSAHWRAKPMTPAQRAAVSAHWSAALRAKVTASAEAERNLVTYSEVEPWE